MATIPLEAAAAAMREAMRDTVKRYSLWYLIQGILMVVAGILALVYPLVASVAIVYLLAWVLIISVYILIINFRRSGEQEDGKEQFMSQSA